MSSILTSVYVVMNFLYGATIGSFLGVVGMRLPRGEKITEPKRSYCETCKRTLTWLELVPILSWIFQGGKCKGCKSEIPIIYPMIELYTAVVFVMVYLSMESLTAMVIGYMGAILIVVYHLVIRELKGRSSYRVMALMLLYLILVSIYKYF